MSHFRSAPVEPLSHATEFKDAHTQTGHVSDQVRGLVCHGRSKRRIVPCLHPSSSQEVPEVCLLWAKRTNIGFFPSALHSRPSRSQTVWMLLWLHRWVDFRSVGASSSWASICHSRPHERAGVKTKHQEKCAFSTTENHLSVRGVGFNQ